MADDDIDPGAEAQAADIAFRFDAKNKRAARIAKLVSSKLVTGITSETREAIRIVITRAIREGMHPYDAARLIVGVVSKPGATTNEMPGLAGLNSPQVHAALNYRAGLLDMGHPPAAIDRLMGKYVTRKLRERAEMIARSETMFALNTGAEAGWMQARRQGYLPPGARVEWIVTPDERLCPSCMAMKGKTKPIGGTFDDGSTGPPRHPNCRCTLAITEEK